MVNLRTLILVGIALFVFLGIRTWRCFYQAHIQAPIQINLLKKSNDLQGMERWEGIRKRSREAFQINVLLMLMQLLVLGLVALTEWFEYMSKSG